MLTQGTDTIEETAYCLDLTVDRAAPVVVTGAMRNPIAPAPASFTSPDTGPIGRVVEGHPRLLVHPMTTPCYPTPGREVRIGLITACLGDDGALLRHIDGSLGVRWGLPVKRWLLDHEQPSR